MKDFGCHTVPWSVLLIKLITYYCIAHIVIGINPTASALQLKPPAAGHRQRQQQLSSSSRLILLRSDYIAWNSIRLQSHSNKRLPDDMYDDDGDSEGEEKRGDAKSSLSRSLRSSNKGKFKYLKSSSNYASKGLFDRLSVDANYQQTLRKSLRKEKLTSLIHQTLSSIIYEGSFGSSTAGSAKPSDELFKATIVSEVSLTDDCSLATVVITTRTDGRHVKAADKRFVFIWLAQHIHLLRYELSQRLKYLKKIPRLRLERERFSQEGNALDVLAVLDKL